MPPAPGPAAGVPSEAPNSLSFLTCMWTEAPGWRGSWLSSQRDAGGPAVLPGVTLTFPSATQLPVLMVFQLAWGEKGNFSDSDKNPTTRLSQCTLFILKFHLVTLHVFRNPK